MDQKESDLYANIPTKPFNISIAQYLQTIERADGSYTHNELQSLNDVDDMSCGCYDTNFNQEKSIPKPSTRVKIKRTSSRFPRIDSPNTPSELSKSYELISTHHQEILYSMGLTHWPESRQSSPFITKPTTSVKSKTSTSHSRNSLSYHAQSKNQPSSQGDKNHVGDDNPIESLNIDIVPVLYAHYAPYFRTVDHTLVTDSKTHSTSPQQTKGQKRSSTHTSLLSTTPHSPHSSLSPYQQFPLDQLTYHNWFSSQTNPISGVTSQPQQYWTAYHECPAQLPKPTGLELWWNASAVEYMLYKRWHNDLICTTQYNSLVKVTTQNDTVRSQRVFKPPLLQVLPPNFGLLVKPRNPKIMRSIRVTAFSHQSLNIDATATTQNFRQNNQPPTNFTLLPTQLTHNNPKLHNTDVHCIGLFDFIDKNEKHHHDQYPSTMIDSVTTSSAIVSNTSSNSNSTAAPLIHLKEPIDFQSESSIQQLLKPKSLTFLEINGVPDLYPYLCLYTARDMPTTLKNEEERTQENPFEAHFVHNSYFSSEYPPLQWNLQQPSTPHYPSNNQSQFLPPTAVSTFHREKVQHQDIPHLKSFSQLTGSKLSNQRSFHGICLVLSAQLATEYAAGLQPSHNTAAPSTNPSFLPTLNPIPTHIKKALNPLYNVDDDVTTDIHHLPLGSAFPYIFKTSNNFSATTTSNFHHISSTSQVTSKKSKIHSNDSFFAAQSLQDAYTYLNPNLASHFSTPTTTTTTSKEQHLTESVFVMLLTWQHRFVILEIPPTHQSTLLPHLQPNSVIFLSGEDYRINQHIQHFAQSALNKNQPIPDQTQLSRFHEHYYNSINFIGQEQSPYDVYLASKLQDINAANDDDNKLTSIYDRQTFLNNNDTSDEHPVHDVVSARQRNIHLVSHPQIFSHRQILTSIPPTALTRCPIITPTKQSDITVLVNAGKLATKFYEAIARESVFTLSTSANTSISQQIIFPFMRCMDQFLDGQASLLMKPLLSTLFHSDHRFHHLLTFYSAEKIFLARSKALKSLGIERDDGRTSWINADDSDNDDDFDGRPDHVLSSLAIIDLKFPTFNHVKAISNQITNDVVSREETIGHSNNLIDDKKEQKEVKSSLLKQMLQISPNINTFDFLLKLLKDNNDADQGGDIIPTTTTNKRNLKQVTRTSPNKSIVTMMHSLNQKQNIFSNGTLSTFGYQSSNTLSAMGVDRNIVLHIPDPQLLQSARNIAFENTLLQHPSIQRPSIFKKPLAIPTNHDKYPIYPLSHQLHLAVGLLFALFSKCIEDTTKLPTTTPSKSSKAQLDSKMTRAQNQQTTQQQKIQQFQTLYRKFKYLIPPHSYLHKFPSLFPADIITPEQFPDIDTSNLLYIIQALNYNCNRTATLSLSQLQQCNEDKHSVDDFHVAYPLSIIPYKNNISVAEQTNLPSFSALAEALSISSQFSTKPYPQHPYILLPQHSTPTTGKNRSSFPATSGLQINLPHPQKRYNHTISSQLISNILFSAQYPLLQYNQPTSDQLQAIKPLLYLLSVQFPQLPSLGTHDQNHGASNNTSSTFPWNPFYDSFDVLASSNKSFVPKEDPSIKELGLKNTLLLQPQLLPIKFTDPPSLIHSLFSNNVLSYAQSIQCIKDYAHLAQFPPSTSGVKDRELNNSLKDSLSTGKLHPHQQMTPNIPLFTSTAPLAAFTFQPPFAKIETTATNSASFPPTKALSAQMSLPALVSIPSIPSIPQSSSNPLLITPSHSHSHLSHASSSQHFLIPHYHHLQAAEPPKLPALLQRQIIDFCGTSNIVSRFNTNSHPHPYQLNFAAMCTEGTLTPSPEQSRQDHHYNPQVLAYSIHQPAFRQVFTYLLDQKTLHDSGVYLMDEEDDAIYSDTDFDPSEVYEVGRNEQAKNEHNHDTEDDDDIFDSLPSTSIFDTGMGDRDQHYSIFGSSTVSSLDSQYKQKQQAQLMKLGLDYTHSVILFIEDLNPIENAQDVDLINTIQPDVEDLSSVLIFLEKKQESLQEQYPHFAPTLLPTNSSTGKGKTVKSAKTQTKPTTKSITITSRDQLTRKRLLPPPQLSKKQQTTSLKNSLSSKRTATKTIPPISTRRSTRSTNMKDSTSSSSEFEDDEDHDEDQIEEDEDNTSQDEDTDEDDQNIESDDDFEDEDTNSLDESLEEDDKSDPPIEHQSKRKTQALRSVIASFIALQRHSPVFYPLLQQIYRTAQNCKQKYIMKQFSSSLLPRIPSKAKNNSNEMNSTLKEEYEDFYPAPLLHGEQHFANFLSPSHPPNHIKPPPTPANLIDIPQYYHISITNLLSNSAAPLFQQYNYNNTSSKGTKIYIDHGLHHVTYSGLHARPYKIERRARLIDEPTAKWVICDNPKCMKWRVLSGGEEWQYPKFFCGFYSVTPNDDACSELDDWILRCMQGEVEICKQLAQLGVTTIEIFSHKPELLDTIRQIGISFDIDSQTLKRLR